MRLKKLEIKDFRNIADAKLDFEGTREFFLGKNGEGKTNLLEAIAYACAFKSFRTAKKEALVGLGKQEAILRFHFEHEKRGETTLGVALSSSKRRVSVDEVNIRQTEDTLGVFPIVALSLADRELLYGGPEARREEIDTLVCQVDSAYYKVLRDYEEAMKARNALLQAEQRPTAEQFDAFEAIMENCARRIIKSRARAIELIRPAFAAAFAAFAPEGEAPDITYCPNAPHEELQALWKSLREGKDAALGHTSRGPHRDNYAITLNGNLAELYASEGQKFSLVLALKLSGLNFLHEKLGIAPILVADDLLLELDAMRQERFWKSLGNLQVFASGTTPPRPSDDKPWNIWNAKQGTFAR